MATGGNLRAALALAAAALLAACATAQMPPGTFGGSRPTFTAVKSDLPYIRCGVCEALAKNAYRQVKAAREALRPGKKARARCRRCAGPAWACCRQVCRSLGRRGRLARKVRVSAHRMAPACHCCARASVHRAPASGPRWTSPARRAIEHAPSRLLRLSLGTVCNLLCCTVRSSSSAAWRRRTAQQLELTAPICRGAASPTLAAARGGSSGQCVSPVRPRRARPRAGRRSARAA